MKSLADIINSIEGYAQDKELRVVSINETLSDISITVKRTETEVKNGNGKE